MENLQLIIPELFISIMIMFLLIFFTHRENIKRLKNKEETKTKIY